MPPLRQVQQTLVYIKTNKNNRDDRLRFHLGLTESQDGIIEAVQSLSTMKTANTEFKTVLIQYPKT